MGNRCSLLQNGHIEWVTWSPTQEGTTGSVAGSNVVGHKADRAPPPIAEWSYTSTMLYMPSWCG